jgi:hypothetical protein
MRSGKRKALSMNQGGGQKGKRKGKSKPAEGGPTKATRVNAQRASQDSITKTVS